MAKAPQRRVVKRVQRTPQIDQSRGAGAAVPGSAAATAPPPGAFYDAEARAPLSPAAAAAGLLGAAASARGAHNARVEDESVHDEELPHASVDVSIALAAQDPPPPNETLDQQIARIRTIRRPLGAFSQKLALAERAGYKRHWFNDAGGRIDDALANGWAQVLDKDKKPYRRAVGTGRDKGVLYAFAMEIPKVFWDEDMAARHAVAAEKIAALKTSPARADPSRGVRAEREDSGKFYSPVEDQGRDAIDVRKV